MFFEQHPVALAALTGFISGTLLAIPIGPVNLAIINEGARKGFRTAFRIGMGALLMDIVYCAIAFTGFATFFERGMVKAAMELVSFVFMLFLGIKFLSAKTVTAPTHLTDKTDALEARVREKFHPTSAFMQGFVRVMANPGVLLFWIVVAANFISRDWVDAEIPHTRLACVCGVAAGVGIWFTVLSYFASFGHGKLSEKTLLKLEHGSGIALLVLAALHGWNIVHTMVQHSRHL
jgi:threonine/homoserine/homoserine lactone efflux protein